MAESVLEISDIAVEFPVKGGAVRALDGVSLRVQKGETVAVVGESGCGKTTLARVILGLQPIVSGEVRVEGTPVDGVAKGQASKIGMVWQDPYASLDPRWRIRKSIQEPLTVVGTSRSTDEMLVEVGLEPKFAQRYPHQLSGGQRQRVAIGRAIAARPPLVICDEPTAALDLSIQAQILNLLRDLQERTSCAYLYISHDLLTVRFLANRLAVMYLGRIVEEGPSEEIFKHPRHPYTRALIESAPTIEAVGKLPEPVEGELPDPRTRFVGCRFASRCPKAQQQCLDMDPAPVELGGVRVWCHFPYGNEDSTIAGASTE